MGGSYNALPKLAPSPPWGEGGGERLAKLLRIYKISKRQDDDISAVCLGTKVQIKNGVAAPASIGAGGVAAVPSRAVNTEIFLTGQPWTAHRPASPGGAARRVFANFRHARLQRLPQQSAGQPAAALLARKPGDAADQPRIVCAGRWAIAVGKCRDQDRDTDISVSRDEGADPDVMAANAHADQPANPPSRQHATRAANCRRFALSRKCQNPSHGRGHLCR